MVNVSVRFHAAEKNIPETGQFVEERGLIGLTVPCSWGSLTIMAEGKEEQVPSYMDGSKQRENKEGSKAEDPDKTIRSHETYSLLREQYEGNCPHDSIISHQVPPTTCKDYRDSRRDLDGDTAKPYHRYFDDATVLLSYHVHIDKPIKHSYYVVTA